MKCSGCTHENADDARQCSWCGGMLYDHPWCVWWRYRWDDPDRSTAWHDAPKLYKSESAARNAERDLNREYSWLYMKARIQHIALPRGVHPRELYI